MSKLLTLNEIKMKEADKNKVRRMVIKWLKSMNDSTSDHYYCLTCKKVIWCEDIDKHYEKKHKVLSSGEDNPVFNLREWAMLVFNITLEDLK